MKRLLVIFQLYEIIVLLLIPGLLGATQHFVANSGDGGSDSNDGASTSTPWETCDHAMSNVSAGDTVYFMGGSYAENNAGYGSFSEIYTTLKIGTDSLYIRNAPGYGRPIFSAYGWNSYTDGDTFTQAITINANVVGTTIESVYVHWSMRGILGGANNDYTTIQYCEVCSTGRVDFGGGEDNNAGICFEGDGNSNLLIQYNTLHHNFTKPSGEGTNGSGIELYSTKNSIIRYNTIYDQLGAGSYWGGIFLKNSAGGAGGDPVDSNEVYGNTVYGALIGINCYHWARYNLIHDNIIYNCTQGLIVHGGWDAYSAVNTYNKFYNNTVYNCTYGLYQYIWGAGGEGQIDSTTFYNNLVVNDGSGDWGISFNWITAGDSANMTNLSSDYNNYYNTANSDIARWSHESVTNYDFTLAEFQSAFSLETNSQQYNPYFLSVDSTSADFLKPDSSQVNAFLITGGVGSTYIGAVDPGSPAAPETSITASLDTMYVGYDSVVFIGTTTLSNCGATPDSIVYSSNGQLAKSSSPGLADTVYVAGFNAETQYPCSSFHYATCGVDTATITFTTDAEPAPPDTTVKYYMRLR